MAAPELAPVPRMPLPRSIPIDIAGSLTPNEMRALKAHTGRSLTELLGGDPENLDEAPDRVQAIVYVQLRREGYDPTWDEAGDVLPDYQKAEPDPTVTGPSDSSSTSAVSGA